MVAAAGADAAWAVAIAGEAAATAVAAAGEAPAWTVAAPETAAPTAWVATVWTVGCEGVGGAAPAQAVSARSAGTASTVESTVRNRRPERSLVGLSFETNETGALVIGRGIDMGTPSTICDRSNFTVEGMQRPCQPGSAKIAAYYLQIMNTCVTW